MPLTVIILNAKPSQKVSVKNPLEDSTMNSVKDIVKTNVTLGNRVLTPDGVGWVKKMSIDHDGQNFIEDSADCFVVFDKPISTGEYCGTCYGMTYKLSQVVPYEG